MNKLFLLLSSIHLTLLAEVPDCSKIYQLFQTQLSQSPSQPTQEQKNKALHKAFYTYDYCATKYWLEKDANIQEAFKARLEYRDGKVVIPRSVVLLPISLNPFKGLFSSPSPQPIDTFADWDELMKQYGVEIRHYK